MILVHRDAKELYLLEVPLIPTEEASFTSISKFISALLSASICLLFGFSSEQPFTSYWFPH